jgi:hypothetical protein
MDIDPSHCQCFEVPVQAHSIPESLLRLQQVMQTMSLHASGRIVVSLQSIRVCHAAPLLYTGTHNFATASLTACLQAESMPQNLIDVKIDRETFLRAQVLVRKFHRVSFPIFFWHGTGHHTNVPALRRLVKKSCKIDMPDVRCTLLW